MTYRSSYGVKDVVAVYSGPERALWELVMGEQIHIGGLESSLALADRAGIGAGMRGVDLCCCTGAGMRFLVQLRGVSQMTGVDATAAAIEIGKERCMQQGMADRIGFRLADAKQAGLESGAVDFVWGEDAWCYVEDKPRLIEEAVRLVKPGGIVAFTDWVTRPEGLPDDAAKRFYDFMKFPDMQSISGYRDLLERQGCEVIAAEDTGRFAPCVDLYVAVAGKQFGYDVLRILGFNMEVAGMVGAELLFVQEMAHAGWIVQGMFVARKPS